MDDLISREETPKYIERQAALDALLWELCGTGYQSHGMRAVERVPAADVKPVRHGRWIEKPYLLGTSRFCSLCGSNYGMPHEVYNFCPNCGAKMDSEV